ncbi:hypothetical protein L1987_75530 [Smallanthus sonchifolius]|uniref:Uncharacterized protein n=1 Tax=Smallanthus sonchifolius TaxID=185202 RepID=A0ACB9AA29_9ASTR|nr:hypothetical protein L1987_75530 [Smallanthus sonchifolius]
MSLSPADNHSLPFNENDSEEMLLFRVICGTQPTRHNTKEGCLESAKECSYRGVRRRPWGKEFAYFGAKEEARHEEEINEEGEGEGEGGKRCRFGGFRRGLLGRAIRVIWSEL